MVLVGGRNNQGENPKWYNVMSVVGEHMNLTMRLIAKIVGL